jgi:predicted transposase YbfD/YdcC
LENKKGNEGEGVEDLLEMLDLKDVNFTMDALHCKKTLQKIVEHGNHYLVKVKGNQPKLLQAIEDTVVMSSPINYYREEEISRGRLEIRETYLYERQDNIAEGWESISRIAYVHRIFLSKNKEHKTDSFYISDLKTDDAEYIADGIRSHWGIENKLHYTNDLIMREDAECTKDKQAAVNLALLRDFAFNILKSTNKSIKYACEIFANYNVKELYNIYSRT